MYFFMLSFCVLWVFGDCISNDSRWHLLSLFPKCWAGPADAAAAQPGVNWWLMEWGYLIRLPKNTYKYILLYPAHMFLTVGMTLGIRVPVVGPLKDINFQKHSGAPLAVLVYIYVYWYTLIYCLHIHIPYHIPYLILPIIYIYIPYDLPFSGYQSLALWKPRSQPTASWHWKYPGRFSRWMNMGHLSIKTEERCGI